LPVHGSLQPSLDGRAAGHCALWRTPGPAAETDRGIGAAAPALKAPPDLVLLIGLDSPWFYAIWRTPRRDFTDWFEQAANRPIRALHLFLLFDMDSFLVLLILILIEN
jgi:hypothetical protein